MARDRKEIVKDVRDTLKQAGMEVPDSYEITELAAVLSVVMVSYQARAKHMHDLVSEIRALLADEILTEMSDILTRFSDGRQVDD